MRIALICDTFPPLRTSGAVQLRDLSREFVRQGHELTVILPAPGLETPWRLESVDGIQLLRLRSPKTKDVNYVRRTLGELWMPHAMRWRYRWGPLNGTRWDGVVWYAPSIFFGPIVHALKAGSQCPSYLVLRDIFPEWAVDMGLMSRGLVYRFFKGVERYQYSVADTVGVQTPGNLRYLSGWQAERSGRRLEVLQNWLEDGRDQGCRIRVADTPLAGRRVLVYAGNMGVAQGMEALIDLAEDLKHRSDIGVLFVGRGSESQRLQDLAAGRGLDNVLFREEIDPDEIPGLYAQCHVGLVALDRRHKTHNIPGKFVSYMQAGLPVLALLNPGNDLLRIIREERVGIACDGSNTSALREAAEALVDARDTDPSIRARCRDLYARAFSPTAAVRQIVSALAQPC